MKHIPFNLPFASGQEYEFIRQAIENGHVSGDGPFTKKCQRLLEQLLGVPRVLLTTSCTDALEMAALLLDIQPGDEVIVPSFTFVSTVNAFVLRGARPVFADIRPDTLNLDERQLPALIGPRTKAILPVHYAGVGCEMDSILEFASRHQLAVVEDNAHGLFGRYRGRLLGTLGKLAALSFHETKNISCGEGGGLLINDPDYIERAEILREKGTNRSRFFRGQVDKYTWVDLGSSFLPSDILAAFLYAQLEARENIQSARRRIWECYAAGLADWAHAHDVRLPCVPDHCQQPYHMFYLLMPSQGERDGMIAHLKKLEITSVFHYLPLHLSDMGRRHAAQSARCPVTEDVSARLVRLPFYNQLTQADQMRVIEAVHGFYTRDTVGSIGRCV
ncbi:MAG TPA: dTDP-4-amino-4,6-dideoxygalactose transaminase [Bryobacteraceae bacterium]|nr:dTDP-4-amino-4,6-dideoxygalactose transaminase [Bryobacteraceae bacterium]